MTPQPKAILFDLDGTLIDSAPDFFDVINELRAEAALPTLPHHLIRAQVSNGGMALTQLTWEIDTDHPEFMAYRHTLLERYLANIGSASGLFDGFADVLAELEQRHIAWGIVTNKPRRYTDALLARLPLHAPLVICPEDVQHPKPHPEPLLLAAKQLNVDVRDCWYVGDHVRDINAGNAANMITIAAAFGYIEPHDDIEQWQADWIIQHPRELLVSS
ncbi:MAG: HAD-IA family hydrolase [Bacterioplanes sp.]|nr:HAD-IA family hydrolase [Bacterioplanes sp.]